MPNRKDRRLENGFYIHTTRIPNKLRDYFKDLKESEEVKSENDAILQAITYWLIHCKGYQL